MNLLFVICGYTQQGAEMKIYFLNEYLTFHQFSLEDKYLRKDAQSLSRKKLVDFNRALQKSKAHNLIPKLLEYRSDLNLPDWYYYRLVTELIDQGKSEYSEWQRTLMIGYLLNRSGFDCKLYLDKENDKANLFIYTKDNVFPRLEENTRLYACLNCPKTVHPGSEVTGLKPRDKQGVKSFSFILDHLPKTENTYHLDGTLGDRETGTWFDYKYDYDLVLPLEEFPIVDLITIYSTPLSPVLKQSLIPGLKAHIEDMTETEALVFLASLVRSNFPYLDDLNSESFGVEKWMTPEEVLHYKFGDCDDFSGLFYSLVKEILYLPMIIIVYDKIEHVNIGVGIDDYDGKTLKYNKGEYVVFELTPEGSVVSDLFLKEKYKIVGEYYPKVSPNSLE